MEVAVGNELHEDEQRRIVFNDVMDIGCNEEVLTSEPSLSTSASLTSLTSKTSSILDSIGPLQGTTPREKSKRGRKSMQSAELTSPETMSVFEEEGIRKSGKESHTEESNTEKCNSTCQAS